MDEFDVNPICIMKHGDRLGHGVVVVSLPTRSPVLSISMADPEGAEMVRQSLLQIIEAGGQFSVATGAAR
ncbi:hypothetical protein GGQ86_002954 [Xanthobacter flavus]|uniref:IclR-ED domain-containing protein n=1 Tax=Xanthobacter flavus TaxID=281 RepID=A0ABU1KKA5_XANFL|nr:hypothetical protein [Xanthobacter flavus]MDR6334472.1 hypothetical protein [Xanthobacter flavus]